MSTTSPNLQNSNWYAIKRCIAEQWPELDPMEVEQTRGDVQRLVGLLQNQYGLSMDIATRQIVDTMRQAVISQESPTRLSVT